MGIGQTYLAGYNTPGYDELYPQNQRNTGVRTSAPTTYSMAPGAAEVAARTAQPAQQPAGIQQPAPFAQNYMFSKPDTEYWDMVEKRKTGEVDRSTKLREASRFERETGIRERESAQKTKADELAYQAGEITLDREKKLQEHQAMMQAFVTKDPMAIMTWFVKNAPKGKDGSQRIPMIDIGLDGNWLVEWPGSKEAVPMDDQTLGRVLQALSPKYEQPKSEKEVVDLENAKKGYGIKGMTVKDLEDLRQKQAKNISEGAGFLPGEEGATTYQDAYNQLGGGMFSPQPAPQEQAGGIVTPQRQATRTVVKTGRTKDGRRVFQYSDGTREIVDQPTQAPVQSGPVQSSQVPSGGIATQQQMPVQQAPQVVQRGNRFFKMTDNGLVQMTPEEIDAWRQQSGIGNLINSAFQTQDVQPRGAITSTADRTYNRGY
jgi:hypothetical protein